MTIEKKREKVLRDIELETFLSHDQ